MHSSKGHAAAVMAAMMWIAPTFGQSAANRAYQVVYFDGHMHTTHSDGSGSIADVKEAALARGLSAVFVTNHTGQIVDLEEWQAIVAETQALSEQGFLMFPAFEITGSEGMFNRDHVLAWRVPDPFVGDDADALAPEEFWVSPFNPAGTGPMYPEVIRQWTDYVHSFGGLAVHAHTSGTTQTGYGVDFIELYNLSHVKDVAEYALAMGFPADQAWGLGTVFNNFAVYGNRDLYDLYPFPGSPVPLTLRDALYMATSMLTGVGQWLDAPEAAAMNSWDDLLMAYVNGETDRPVFGLANSDAHNTGNLPIGGAGYDDSDVGEVRNGVYLRHFNRATFMHALRSGHLFATTGPSVYLEVNGRIMGETAHVLTRNRPPARGRRPGLRGTARINVSAAGESESAVLVRVDIIRNGEVWQSVSPLAATYECTIDDTEVSGDGYYRVEVVSLDTATGMYQFAWANPVFVRVH